jgi:hypothetical protein
MPDVVAVSYAVAEADNCFCPMQNILQQSHFWSRSQTAYARRFSHRFVTLSTNVCTGVTFPSNNFATECDDCHLDETMSSKRRSIQGHVHLWGRTWIRFEDRTSGLKKIQFLVPKLFFPFIFSGGGREF